MSCEQPKQCKGKDLDKVPTSKLNKEGLFLTSIKYDGNYVCICKAGNNIRFYTSGNKEFYLNDVAKELKKIPESFIIEGEYIELTKGKLGSRPKAAKLTTYRTNFNKGIPSNLGNETIMLFDIINDDTAMYRESKLVDLFYHKINGLEIAETLYYSFDDALQFAKDRVAEGYEGAMIKHESHQYLPGKRVNDCIKLKYRKTADLLCTGINEGEGKYEGMIGSLSLMNSAGIEVDVGSGLDDADRSMPWNHFIGKVIEIEYEQIMDTYIQPVFKCVRGDKAVWEIDQ